MSRNNKHHTHIRIFSLISLCVFLSAPPHAHATFTSQNYTIDTHTIGTTQSSMFSPNYTLTPSKGNTFTQPSSSTSTPTTNGGSTTGGSSGGNLVTKPADERPFIINSVTDSPYKDTVLPTGQTQAVQAYEKSDLLVPSNKFNQDVVNTVVNTSEVSGVGLLKKDSNRSAFLASLISGDMRGVGKYLSDLYERMFSNRYFRASFFLCVLALLLYVRTYTAFGKRYTPF